MYEGETAEDAEARTLLNKFIGSQVLLSGMETQQSHSTDASMANKKITKVTTTHTVSFYKSAITTIQEDSSTILCASFSLAQVTVQSKLKMGE